MFNLFKNNKKQNFSVKQSWQIINRFVVIKSAIWYDKQILFRLHYFIAKQSRQNNDSNSTSTHDDLGFSCPDLNSVHLTPITAFSKKH